jgi:molybdate transport system substrate-binding protein
VQNFECRMSNDECRRVINSEFDVRHSFLCMVGGYWKRIGKGYKDISISIKYMARVRLLMVLIAFIVSVSSSWAQGKILVAAASDLKFALDSVVAVFKMKNAGVIEVTYGSSGKLSEQISNGAPFDVFFSADIEYPKQLKEKNFTASDIYVYGIGRIVLWSKNMDPEKEGMKSMLQASVKKVAIANPQHAPYGKRALEALVFYQVHDAVKDKLVLGENISQAAQFVTSGAADMGIVAYSLALSPNMKEENGKFYLIPENAHKRLEQGVVITKHGKGNDFAQTFLSFVKSEEAKAALSHFGFK